MTNEQDSLQQTYNHAHISTDKQINETSEDKLLVNISLAFARYDNDVKKRAAKENMTGRTR